MDCFSNQQPLNVNRVRGGSLQYHGDYIILLSFQSLLYVAFGDYG